MSKNEFLDRLFGLLSDLSQEERDEALAYYREYIEDAGLENEEAIMEELGTPEEVAAEIKSGILIKGNSSEQERSQQEKQHTFTDDQFQKPSEPQKNSNTALIVLAVIVAVLLSPVWIGLLGTIFGVVFGFLASIAGLILGFGIGGLVCLFVGIILFFAGFPTIFHNLLGGVAMIGGGLVVTAIGILFLLFTGLLCIVVIPWAIKGIRSLIQKLSNRKKEVRI